MIRYCKVQGWWIVKTDDWLVYMWLRIYGYRKHYALIGSHLRKHETQQ